MEEPFYIFPIQGFCNNIYENTHKIIDWEPNGVKKNVDRVKAAAADASEVRTGGGKISEEGEKMGHVTYPNIPRCI